MGLLLDFGGDNYASAIYLCIKYCSFFCFHFIGIVGYK